MRAILVEHFGGAAAMRADQGSPRGRELVHRLVGRGIPGDVVLIVDDDRRVGDNPEDDHPHGNGGCSSHSGPGRG